MNRYGQRIITPTTTTNQPLVRVRAGIAGTRTATTATTTGGATARGAIATVAICAPNPLMMMVTVLALHMVLTVSV